MLRDFRTVSFRILNDVFITRRWARESIEANMKGLSDAHSDIKKVYELVYGIMRNKRLIDHCLAPFIRKPVEDPKLMNILRIGFYQLRHMDSIPPYAAVDSCVNLARQYIHPKTSGFVNAVLRSLLRSKKNIPEIPRKDEVAYQAILLSYEEWMARFFYRHFPDSAETIMKAGNSKPPIFLRVNTLKTTSQKLLKKLKENGVLAEQLFFPKNAILVTSGDAVKTPSFEEGLFQVQDLSSQLLCEIISPSQKDAVIDVGSAPGGKTAAFSMAMSGMGKILAIEPQKSRITMMEQNFLRLGVTNAEIMQHDATVPVAELEKKADKVLVDAPCSALGVIRRHPEKKWCITENELKQFPGLQLAILENSSAWVKKGGELFYSTCTLNPKENIGVAERFLKKNRDFKAVDVCGRNPKLRAFRKGNYFQSAPGNSLNMDGFFIARFARK
ncbi:MAG TPA: 16S rRNA (cytosine(967)-C(5))-methyltransferase RsmB [Candidatus Goldiibacteriota bacterium]|nr:16S rRNA (cytosine(967)-C(5))-methyltransferase RsmB [Candidatus Goldiibacteriota bacterium]